MEELKVKVVEVSQEKEQPQGNWKIQCKLPPKTKRFCPLVLK